MLFFVGRGYYSRDLCCAYKPYNSIKLIIIETTLFLKKKKLGISFFLSLSILAFKIKATDTNTGILLLIRA